MPVMAAKESKKTKSPEPVAQTSRPVSDATAEMRLSMGIWRDTSSRPHFSGSCGCHELEPSRKKD